MTTSHCFACVFAGMLLANAVPHFVHGISGDRFPTPFAKPPGQGLSSPTLNMAWALFNLAAFYFVGRSGDLFLASPSALASAFGGVAVTGLFSSVHFQKKHPA